jgi:hypothetical protein
MAANSAIIGSIAALTWLAISSLSGILIFGKSMIYTP